MGKYVIESKFKNTRCFLEVACENSEPYFFFNRVDSLTPYTEPDLDAIREEEYEKGVQDTKQHWVDAPRSCAYKLGYENGLNDAWEAARKIANIPYGEEEKVIGSDGWTFIINHTASEAIEKIRQYEQEEDRQARIEFNCEEIKDVLNTTVKECNVSLDEIAAVLEKMRGETNE